MLATVPLPARTFSLKFRTRSDAGATLAALSAGLALSKTGGVVSGGGRGTVSQPSTSMSLISAEVTAFTSPELPKARNESCPALEAQSPKSPPEFVLKLSRLVAPLSGEKYPD